MVKVASYTHIGTRKKNEDALIVDEPLGLYAVADGVGGGLHGDIASRMVVERVHRSRAEGVTLRKAIDLAQKELVDFSIKNFGDPLMGTTFTAVEVKKDGLQLAHVGDSRCYHFTGKMLRQLTEDHESYEESMQNTVLSDYVGMPDEMIPLKVQSEFLPFSGTQRFLLSTDGLHKQLSAQEIVTVIEKCDSVPTDVVQRLCHVATQRDESDNVTVIFMEITFG